MTFILGFIIFRSRGKQNASSPTKIPIKPHGLRALRKEGRREKMLNFGLKSKKIYWELVGCKEAVVQIDFTPRLSEKEIAEKVGQPFWLLLDKDGHPRPDSESFSPLSRGIRCVIPPVPDGYELDRVQEGDWFDDENANGFSPFPSSSPSHRYSSADWSDWRRGI